MKRLEYADCVKVVVIFMVVLEHTHGSWLQFCDIGAQTPLCFFLAMFVGRIVCKAAHTLAWRLKASSSAFAALSLGLCAMVTWFWS